MNAQHNDLQQAHDAKAQELDETKTAVDNLQAENNALKEESAAKDGKISELEAAAAAAATAAAALTAEVKPQ